MVRLTLPFRMHKISRASLHFTVQRSEVFCLRRGCWLRDVPSWMCGMSADSQPSIWRQDEVMWQCCDYCWRRQCWLVGWLVEGPGWSVSGWRLLLKMVKIIENQQFPLEEEPFTIIFVYIYKYYIHNMYIYTHILSMYLYYFVFLCLFGWQWNEAMDWEVWSIPAACYGETVELLLFDGNLLVYHHL